MIFRRQVRAAPPKCASHPYKLVEKTLHPIFISRVEKVSLLIEFALYAWKIEIGECYCKAEFTDHRNARLDTSGSAPRAGRNADKRDRFVNILAQEKIEHRFQTSGIAVIVLRRYDHKTV